MKNIHVLPTVKPTNLLLCIKSYIEHKDTPEENSDNKGNFRLGFGKYANKVFYKPHHIYITSDEEIKKGDYGYIPFEGGTVKCIGKYFANDWRKIILTTDQDLIKEGVQEIPDDFLEWFVKNPSCESVEIKEEFIQTPDNLKDGFYYKIIIPKEEPKQDALNHFLSTSNVIVKDPQKWDFNKQETLEEAAERLYPVNNTGSMFMASREELNNSLKQEGFIEGVKWQQERSYSEEYIAEKLFNHPAICAIRDSKSDAEARRIILQLLKKK